MGDEVSSNLDNILVSLGRYGKWQIYQFVLLCLAFIPMAFQYANFVFIAYVPYFKCDGTSNVTFSYILNNSAAKNTNHYNLAGDIRGHDIPLQKQCDIWDSAYNESRSCEDNFRYGGNSQASIVSEWDLVCDWGYLPALTQVIFTVGEVCGNAILVPLADRYGRKRTIVSCHCILFVVSMLIALSPNIFVFIVGRFVTGFFHPGVYSVTIIAILEIFPKNEISTVSAFSKIFWSSGIILLCPIAYWFRDESWRYLQLTLSVASMILVVQICIMNESVRWLFALNRRKEAISVIKKAAKMNNVHYENKIQPSIEILYCNNSKTDEGKHLNENLNLCDKKFQLSGLGSCNETYEYTKSSTGDKEMNSSLELAIQPFDITKNDQKYGCVNEIGTRRNTERDSFLEVQLESSEDKVDEGNSVLILFKHKRLRTLTCSITYLWTVCLVIYFGLLLLSPALAGDRFLNVCLNGAIEIPGYILSMYTLKRFNRKTCILWFHVFTGGMLASATIVNVAEALTTLGKLGASGIAASTFLYGSEVFPTSVRGRAVGFCTGVSKLGTIISPFSSYLALFGLWIPTSFFVVLCVTVCILLIFLPETRDRPLPQTIADL